MNLSTLNSWGIPNNNPLIIAGPCSAESPEQLLTTCKQINSPKVSFFRAGIWKPRTRPGSFEGVGTEGLKWFQEVKKELGKPITTEVANAKHVEDALKHDVDVLWIGARSTVNPFTVQEIADAIKGVDIPVIIKNPLNPDLNLWIGAIERIYQSGTTKIAALHRGFSSFGNSRYRNIPMWQIPLALKSQFPEIPLLCDPSHIGGKRELIHPISQKALDLNYDGLMIETHYNPSIAKSDAKQQLNPASLHLLLENLVIRKEKFEEGECLDELGKIRDEIDNKDKEILEAISNRLDLVDRIGNYKKDFNVATFQLERWREILESRPTWANELGLSSNFAEKLFQLIHDESIRQQIDKIQKEL